MARATTIADLREDFARLEGKVDTFINQMAAQDDRTTKQEVRLRKVENRQHWYAGVTAVLGVIGGTFLELVTGHH